MIRYWLASYAIVWLWLSWTMQPDMEDWPFWRWPNREELLAFTWPLMIVAFVVMFGWSVLELLWEFRPWRKQRG